MCARPSLWGPCVLALAMAVGGVSSPAHAKRARKGPTQVVPPKKRAKVDDADLSAGGERRGITEIVLGSVAAGAAVALLGRGIWEVGQSRRAARECETGDRVDLACLQQNPGSGGVIAAGLSFGLTVPFAVASGLLLHRGTTIHRAYKTWKKHQGAVAVTAAGHGAGVTMSLRF